MWFLLPCRGRQCWLPPDIHAFPFSLCYKHPGFAMAGHGLHPQSQEGGSSLPRHPPSPLRGGWERAWGPSLWEDICWGSFPGKAVFLFFFLQAPFPASWDLPSLNLMLRTQQPSEKVQTRERANCRESVGGAEVAESQQDPVPKSDLSESLNHTRS